jgi:hypothetical protein
MNAHVSIPVDTMRNSFPYQHADQAFPSVLVISTLGTIISLAGIWLTALLIA